MSCDPLAPNRGIMSKRRERSPRLRAARSHRCHVVERYAEEDEFGLPRWWTVLAMKRTHSAWRLSRDAYCA